MKKIAIVLLGVLTSTYASAVVFTMAAGSRPPCSSGWSGSSSPYTCTGTITLNGGNSIAPGSATIINGNISTNGGAIGLSNVTLNGNISATSGPAINLTLSNSIVNGNVSHSSNSLVVSGGAINGNLSAGGSGITLTGVNVTGNISSPSNTINISGGTINGNISSSGGSGVVMSNVTMTGGSISATGVPVSISNSTIGSPSAPVSVTGNNTVTISSGSAVYGNVTSGNWAAALSVDSSSFIFGTCTSNSNSVSNPAQYPRCSGGALIAEWRMDEATWDSDNATYEVKDSVGTYHGTASIAINSGQRPITATGSSAYTTANSSLSTCRYGLFDRTSSPARRYGYVQLGSFPTLPAQFTFAGWIRTTDRGVAGQRILVNDDNQNGWALSLSDAGDGILRFFNRNLRRSGSVTGSGSNSACGTNSGAPFCLDTNAVISNNTWYFVAVTVDNAAKRITLYVFDQNGSLQTQVSSIYTNNWTNGTGNVSIGGESSSSSEGQSEDFHFKGNLDELKVYGAALNQNTLEAELTRARSCSALVNHIRIEHDGEGLTCSPELVTVKACADANCASLYAGSVTLNLDPGGAGFVFTGSTTTATVSRTTIGTATLTATDVNPGVISATRCFNGSIETCSMNFVDSGFAISVPAHKAENDQVISIKAVKKADNAVACIPAFQNVSKTIKLVCGYANPAASAYSGRVAVRINNTALNATNNAASACDATGANLSLSFDATGTATPTLKYADVGQMTLVASNTLATTDDMTGSTSFIVAPDHFFFSGVTSGNIKAGGDFSATVTARNAANNATPGFGKEASPGPESVTLGLGTRVAPSGTDNCSNNGPCDGVVTGNVGAWSTGVASASNVRYSEVGQITLRATLTSGSYLGSGLTVIGTSGTVGNFVPAYFDTTVESACVSPVPPAPPTTPFTYSGQPFTVTAIAKNAQDATTVNYSGNFTGCSVCSRLVTLSDVGVGGGGGFNATNTIPAASFLKGEGRTTAIAYTFTNKETEARWLTPQPPAAPTRTPLIIRAMDSTTSIGAPAPTTLTEGSTIVRSGRLRLSNAFGSERQNLSMPVRAEYFSGNSWIANSDDSCTTLADVNFYRVAAPPSLAAFANLVSASNVALSNGVGVLTLGAPNAVGQLDVAANLGTSGNDQSCLNTHGGTSGSRAWLRSQYGNCATTFDRDPSARASFGIYSNSGRVVHVREFF